MLLAICEKNALIISCFSKRPCIGVHSKRIPLVSSGPGSHSRTALSAITLVPRAKPHTTIPSEQAACSAGTENVTVCRQDSEIDWYCLRSRRRPRTKSRGLSHVPLTTVGPSVRKNHDSDLTLLSLDGISRINFQVQSKTVKIKPAATIVGWLFNCSRRSNRGFNFFFENWSPHFRASRASCKSSNGATLKLNSFHLN